MRKIQAVMLAVSTGLVAAGLALAVSPAQATTTTPSEDPCHIGSSWYSNPDEQADKPERTGQGFKFEGKDLTHHAISTPIDFADMDKVTHSFVTTNPGKVVFKVETSSPYSTIVTNADGRIWSTAMTYDQVGGQGNPVAKYTDLLDKPVKPGKVPFTGASRVATFGLGYWVEEGSTVVSSVTFHGTRYPLGCNIPTHRPPTRPTHGPTATPTATVTPTKTATTTPPTTAPTTVPTTVRPTTATPSASASQSSPPVIGINPVGNDTGSLPLTGPSLPLIAGGGVLLILVGVGIFLVSRRRRNVDFTA